MATLNDHYNLFNRDGAKLSLDRIKDNQYVLNVDDKHKYVLEHCHVNRVITEDSINYSTYDPSGGPYMYPGYKVSDSAEISKIFISDNTVIFELK